MFPWKNLFTTPSRSWVVVNISYAVSPVQHSHLSFLLHDLFNCVIIELVSVIFPSCAAVSSFIMFARTLWLGLLILLSLSVEVLGVPQPAVPAAEQSINLKRWSQSARNETEWAQWAKSQRDAVISKYRLGPNEKRATGENL
jgi:hypothetical protein